MSDDDPITGKALIGILLGLPFLIVLIHFGPSLIKFISPEESCQDTEFFQDITSQISTLNVNEQSPTIINRLENNCIIQGFNKNVALKPKPCSASTSCICLCKSTTSNPDCSSNICKNFEVDSIEADSDFLLYDNLYLKSGIDFFYITKKDASIFFTKENSDEIQLNDPQPLIAKSNPEEINQQVLDRINQYSLIIDQASSKYNVDKNLIIAQISVESQGDFKAVSICGAAGLIQLMPATAKSVGIQSIRTYEEGLVTNCNKEYASKLKSEISQMSDQQLQNWNQDQRFNPQENIFAGVKFLSKQINNYNDVQLALAAYNAGETNLNRACNNGKETFDECKNSLPTETQNYVPKILNRQAWLNSQVA